jgi:hypothetical protein
MGFNRLILKKPYGVSGKGSIIIDDINNQRVEGPIPPTGSNGYNP